MNTNDHEPVVNVMGEAIMLGPMCRDQIPVYVRWLNDFETLRNQGEPPQMPTSPDGVERWYDEYVQGRSDVAWFTIYEAATRTPIGWSELKDIDHQHGTAEFAIMIGEPIARGKGYGTETTRLMLKYGFSNLSLHNIHLYYLEFNTAARRAYEKAGFREYGRRAGAHVSNSKRWDVIYMQCISSEFNVQSGEQ